MKLLEDDKAVSPVIGEVLMIAVVVLLAAVVAVFAFGLTFNWKEELSVSILIEDAEEGASNITLAHSGGGAVRDAFAPASPPAYFVNDMIFENLEVKINGEIYEGWASLNAAEIAKRNFEVGDELELGLGGSLSHGDTITVIYAPGSKLLAWEKV
jgi:flagellin-like protein